LESAFRGYKCHSAGCIPARRKYGYDEHNPPRHNNLHFRKTGFKSLYEFQHIRENARLLDAGIQRKPRRCTRGLQPTHQKRICDSKAAYTWQIRYFKIIQIGRLLCATRNRTPRSLDKTRGFQGYSELRLANR